MSVEFDPVRLAPSRRWLDPVAIGVLAVLVGLAVAIVKPWDAGPSAGSAVGVGHLAVEGPDRFGTVPRRDDIPPPVVMVGAAASDVSGVPIGPFATTDRIGVPLAAASYRPLAGYEALDQQGLHDGAHVASISLPRASGLGVMFGPGDLLASASIARLSSRGAPFEAPAPVIEATEHPPRSRYVIFPAPGGVWPPGIYAISVTWMDDGGSHGRAWQIELRPDGG